MKILPATALAAALLAAAASPASATGYYCTWRVEQLGVDSSGSLMLRFVGGPSDGSQFYLCNIGSTSGGIAPESCRAWMSELVAAQSLGRQVGMGFDTGHASNSGLTGCAASNFAGWVQRVPTAVLMLPS